MKKEIVTFILIFIGLLSIDLLRSPDDTDKSRWDRSGMSLYIDHGTGCQYLAGGGFFGKEVLIPRVNKIGMQVCKGE